MPGMLLLQGSRKLLWFCVLREVFFLAFVALQGVGSSKIKGGQVVIESIVAPAYVKVGESVQLQCLWKEKHTNFYRINWYKNKKKFYSYTYNFGNSLHSDPKTTGFKINLAQSNNKVVTLTSLTTAAGGEYECETMAESPQFNTDRAFFNMTVVQLPEVPQFKDLLKRYYLPDEFNISCIAENGYPAPEIEFQVNNVVMTKFSPRVTTLPPLYNPALDLFTAESRLAFPLSDLYHPEFQLVCKAKIGHFEVNSATRVSVEERMSLFLSSDGLDNVIDHILFWMAICASTCSW